MFQLGFGMCHQCLSQEFPVTREIFDFLSDKKKHNKEWINKLTIDTGYGYIPTFLAEVIVKTRYAIINSYL